MKNYLFASHLVAIVLIFKKSLKMQEVDMFLTLLGKKIEDTYTISYDLKSSTNLSLAKININDNKIKRNDDFTKNIIYYFSSCCKNEDIRNNIINYIFEFFKINNKKKYILNKKDFKICICGSMSFAKEMLSIKRKLEEIGYLVTIPKFTAKYAKLNKIKEMDSNESIKNKTQYNLIIDYYEVIKNSDAILVLNFDKNKIQNYIGGNSFLEMGFAHVLKKRIYLLNDIPEMIYKDEIMAMEPIILNNNLFNMI